MEIDWELDKRAFDYRPLSLLNLSRAAILDFMTSGSLVTSKVQNDVAREISEET